MKLKALRSFCGLVSMRAGEIREIADETICKDLILAGYAEKGAEKQGRKENAKNEDQRGNAKSGETAGKG